jgi:Domain of unknown function (DUF4252)
MNWFLSFLVCRAGRCAALTAVVYFGIAAACAQAFAAESASTPGRIDFNEAQLPAATVEVDLSAGMFGDLAGLGEAAIAGVAETLQQASSSNRGSEGTKIAAEQLAAARQLVQLARGVVHEVRVRVYDKFDDGSADSNSLMAQFDDQLQKGNWENIVRVRDGKDSVRVSLLRKEGAILGAFVVASDGHSLVLANLVGDISPENVKKLTSAAATIGLENGLQQVLDHKMMKLRLRLPPAVSPPSPPKQPAVPVNPNVPKPAPAEANDESAF